MKFFKLNILIFFLLLGFIACDDPIPTEIIPGAEETTDYDVEIISSSPSQYVYENGYDSTGVTEPVPRSSSYILMNGIKTSSINFTYKTGTATAVFFDKNLPIFSRVGRLIGYGARYIGKVSFDNDSAVVRPMFLKYIENGIIQDTLVGFQHFLRFDSRRVNAPREFPYGQPVNFKLEKLIGSDISFDINTPPEVTGKIRKNGSLRNNNLNIELSWDRHNFGEFEIIIGGILKSNGNRFPLLRFNTRDDGYLKIPFSVLRSIPYERFDGLIFTLIRRYKKVVTNEELLVDNFIAAQSIHNIIIDIP